MTVKLEEKYRSTSFLELVQFMRYLEDNYGAIAEIHVSTDEDDSADALLCITCVGCCKLHRDPGHNTFASRKVPYSQLLRVHDVLLEMFYEITEEIDGGCPTCLAAAALLN